MTASPETDQPSLIMKLIVIKKGIFALVLIAICLISAFSWRNFDQIAAWSDSYLVNAEYGFVRWLIGAIAHSNVPTLKLVARASGLYGGLLGITAVGLWQGRAWADVLFVVLVGALLPLELLETLHKPTTTHVIIFALNILVFGFVLKHWLDRRTSKTTPESPT